MSRALSVPMDETAEFAPRGNGNSFVPTSRRKPPPIPESPGTRQASGRPVLADEDVDPLCAACGKRRSPESFVDKKGQRKDWCGPCRYNFVKAKYKKSPRKAKGLTNGARWENQHRRHR